VVVEVTQDLPELLTEQLELAERVTPEENPLEMEIPVVAEAPEAQVAMPLVRPLELAVLV
jgi:hypothetical protein